MQQPLPPHAVLTDHPDAAAVGATRALLDAAPALMWVSRADEPAGFFNRAFCDFTGCSLDQLAQNGWMERIHPRDRERRVLVYEQAVPGHRVLEVTYRLCRHDGVYRWIFEQGAPRHDAEGRFAGFVATCVDITAQRRAEELARVQGERATRLETEWLQLLYAASHDLQEPLRMIVSFSDLLGESVGASVSAATAQYLDFVRDGALRIKGFVDGLLELGMERAAGGHGGESDLTAVLEEVRQNLRGQIEETGAELTVRSPLPAIGMDHRDAVRILCNLVANALTFRTERLPRVEIAVEPRQGGFLVSVADNGIGIEEQELDHVFGVFTRLHPPGRYPGVGLGLALCREIVAHYGEHIWITSTAGEGTRVSFTVPTPRAEPATADAVLDPEIRDSAFPHTGRPPATTVAGALDVAPLGILAVESNGTIFEANQEVERLFGYGRGELVGRSVDELVPASSRDAHASMRLRFLAQPQARPMGLGRELMARRKNGSTLPIEVGLAPIHEGGRFWILCTVVDRTQVVAARGELERRAAALDRSNRELEEFASSASHDLQEPLRMVTSFLQLLEQSMGQQMDDEAHTYLRFACDGAERMKAMIGHLLSLARISAQSPDLRPVSCDRLVEHVLDVLRPRIVETGARVECGAMPVVWGDEVQLRSVLQNLIENAIKYRGQDPLVIRLESQEDRGQVVICVSDNGAGFPPEQAEAVFAPFKRVHGSEHSSGSGMGLAIVCKIVERHGGRVWAESTPGEGARFYFALQGYSKEADMVDLSR